MNDKNFMSFEEYRDRLTGSNIDTRPTDVILAELDALEAEMRGGGAKDGA